MAEADIWKLADIRRARRLRRLRAAAKPLGILAAAGAVGLGIAALPAHSSRPAPLGNSPAITECRVTDGDTIRCGDERIRLLGIDAPELPGHCRVGRDCVAGDPYASSDSLAAAMSSSMTIKRVGTDRYGRTLATVAGPSGDLSCWQLTHHQAVYKPKWDNGLAVAWTCPKAALL